jgi:predicted phage tail protein
MMTHGRQMHPGDPPTKGNATYRHSGFQAATAPSAPTDLSVVGGDGAALVSWSPPVDFGSSTGDVSYAVTASDAVGNLCSSCGTSASTFAVSGLPNGAAVTISIVASDVFGRSPAVTASGTPTALAGSPASSYVENAYRSVNTALAALQLGHGQVTLNIRRVYNSGS